MRISLLLPGFGPLLESVSQAKIAERCEFDGVWVAEHIGFHDAPVTAALCLARTSQLEVGLMGLAPGSRHPAVTAMEIASLGEVAPGRVRVQLGTGEPELMNRIGLDPAKPVARVSALVRVIRSILRGRVVTEDSLAGALQDFVLNRPIPESQIPLDVLAIRPKMLALAAQHGDGVCLSGGASRDYVRAALESVGEARPSGDLVSAPFRTTAVVFALVADDWEEHVGSLAQIFGGFPTALAPVIFRGALSEVELEQFEKRVPEDRAELFSVGVLREMAIVCKPSDVEEALSDWFELGLDEICIFPVGPEELLTPALESLGDAVSSLRANARLRDSASNPSCSHDPHEEEAQS